MNCQYCNDTGKMRGSEYLDCGYCDASTERAELESWALLNCGRMDLDDLWAVYQRGKKAKDAPREPDRAQAHAGHG